MKIEKQLNSSHPRLLLFFAGWSASPESFTGLKAENGTDIMLCYDYRDMTFHEDLSSYKEIHLIAWSMGVRMAELALAGKYALTTATAINGTPRPIDDNFGIPENIFRDILAQHEKFPARPLEEVKDELQHIYNLCNGQSMTNADDTTSIQWTRAIISSDDHIFPAANQRNYWNGRCPVTEITAPHYPFYLWKQWNEL